MIPNPTRIILSNLHMLMLVIMGLLSSERYMYTVLFIGYSLEISKLAT